jgi:hypothetical protein
MHTEVHTVRTYTQLLMEAFEYLAGDGGRKKEE